MGSKISKMIDNPKQKYKSYDEEINYELENFKKINDEMITFFDDHKVFIQTLKTKEGFDNLKIPLEIEEMKQFLYKEYFSNNTNLKKKIEKWVDDQKEQYFTNIKKTIEQYQPIRSKSKINKIKSLLRKMNQIIKGKKGEENNTQKQNMKNLEHLFSDLDKEVKKYITKEICEKFKLLPDCLKNELSCKIYTDVECKLSEVFDFNKDYPHPQEINKTRFIIFKLKMKKTCENLKKIIFGNGIPQDKNQNDESSNYNPGKK